MVQGKRNGKMVPLTKEDIRLAKSMVMVFKNGQTEIYTLVVSMKMNYMVLVVTPGVMEEFMMDNG